ncbi:glutamate--tRNA ligase, partial [Nanoarchaeota archaeon]
NFPCMTDIDTTIRKHALKNAADFKGKANPGKLMGKIINDEPEWKTRSNELMQKIRRIVEEVNSLSMDDQQTILEKEYPEMLEKKEAKRRELFEFLGIKEGQSVISAFPPGPEKYPHIGHAKACILNFMLAKRYNGKFLLRFEDTNPKTVKSLFYDMMQKDFRWLGVEWDDLLYASDFMDMYYDLAKKIIAEGHAYVCSCDGEKTALSRAKGIACDCRSRAPAENLELFEDMKTLPEGHAILRMKIDLKHQNTTMRDPTLFRIIDQEHPRQGKKYRVWPNYDWQNGIMDGYLGVTHRVRSKEFELRAELQHYIQDMLGFKQTTTYEMARFNMKGVLSSGRVIRGKIESGELMGWDDPTLTTITALRRRGFLPEAIRNFVVSTGITKNESTLTWDDLIIHNKRLLDAGADRLSFIADPVAVVIKGAPVQEVELNLHPERKGGRKFKTKDLFYITKADFASLETGKLYRLMDCLNFRKTEDGLEFHSTDVEAYKKEGKSIMHWLPQSSSLIETDIMMSDKEIVSGLAEHTTEQVKHGDVVQFERFGFCRLDDKQESKQIFWFTHK